MDMYLSAQDGFNLQEMLDYDIKCEMDESFGFGGELPPLELEDGLNHAWIQTNSNSNLELDIFSGDIPLVVNPSSVLPVPTHLMKTEVKDEDEEKEEEDDSNEYIIPDHVPQLDSPPPINIVVKEEPPVWREATQNHVVVNVKSVNSSSSSPRVISTINGHIHKEQPLSTTHNNNNIVHHTPKVKKLPVATARKQLSLVEDICYPKPGYSYSCLIAMALKNSRCGSLPVSEIYNFMCSHFPYFKTAPNGWKNSVRHNLSLNKCFEKIEKPVSGPGGTQRKGCLWAMNPAKIAKMDDEVAKWSRRDPLAIKKAMLYPDTLEMLERGEMKIGRLHGDSDGEVDTSEEEEIETHRIVLIENGEEDVVNSVVLPIGNAANNEEDTEEEEEVEVEEEEDVQEVDEDEPQPIGSDDSDYELEHIPPSLKPFEPRLALLNRHLNEHSHLNQEMTNSLSHEYSVEVNNKLDIGYEELDMEESRAFLGLDVNSLKFLGESDDESEEDTNLYTHQTYQIVQHGKQPAVAMVSGLGSAKKRKMNSPASPSIIQV